MAFKALYSMDKNILILGLFINGWSILRFLKTIHGILFSHGSLLNLSAWDMFSIISAILKSASWEKEMVTNINHVSNFLQFDWLFWRRLLLAVTSNSLRSRGFWAGKSGTRFSKYIVITFAVLHHDRVDFAVWRFEGIILGSEVKLKRK